MKMSGGPASVNIKVFLLIIALAIGAGTLLYTNSLVSKLQQREREVAQLFANGLEYVANASEETSDLTFLFENIIKPIDFPMILTDAHNNVNLENKTDIRNVRFDSTLSDSALRVFLGSKIIEMDETNSPINVKYVFGVDTLILTKIHYGDSELIYQLKYYPYLLIIIGALFIIIGYIGFSQIKRSEQSNIWVGMAKETAHQFGTPLSSLLGWIEILRLNYNDPDKVLDAADEITNDVEKLNRITYRFSKIGSKPELKPVNLHSTLTKVLEYFTRRIPQTGKKVDLNLSGNKDLMANINLELFDWVIENLIKNALDAIDNNNGKIDIVFRENKKFVEIEVTDNGKGIERNRKKDIFRPGYSTKRRGWGLGLSLSKRIIEEYHKGKIFVKSSLPEQGTVFLIRLKK
ncbi:MAG: HAMP domain-containing sensor histidine kinase [Ignavibacteriaceae bacterium]|jgi:two-component sensor histidine kinase|nr:HAMP domain-containing sensor histidine kinase [Ignavibacteriaceae bacterium]